MSLVVNALFLKFYNVLTKRPQHMASYYTGLFEGFITSKLWQKNIHTTDKK